MQSIERAAYSCVCVISFSIAVLTMSAVNAQTPGNAVPMQSSAPAAKKMPAAKLPVASSANSMPSAKSTNEPFNIEQVLSFSFPETTSLIAAPKGDRVAWVSNTLGRRNIWGAEAPAWNARQITHYGADDGQEITDLDFSSDGALIAYVRGGDKNREGELPDPASDPAGVDQSVWTISWAGTAPHKVDAGNHPHISPHSTAAAGWVAYEKEGKIWIAAIAGGGKSAEIYMRGENSGIEWAPDGRKFAYGMNQYLASHGYIVLSVNYRGGIGYGRAFRTAPNRGGQGASEYQDVLAGANFLRSRDDVDITRLGLWGGSYGGYLTAMGLARNSDLFAAGVDFHGVHDWSQQLANNSLPPGVTAQAVQPQQNTPASILARESSPVASVSTWKSPVLLMQGDDDRNVYFGQMIELVPMLRQQGVPFEQIVFPDEVHDFLMWHSWVQAYHAELDFFDRKLKNAGASTTPARADQ